MSKYNITLLYVEDDLTTAEYMETILQEYFTHVVVAHNAQEAMELCKNNKIDMLLSDIELPDFSGIELVKRLKRHNKNLIVILFSAYDDKSYLLDAIRLSVCDYLIKPFHPQEFEKTMSKCMKKIKTRTNTQRYKDLAYRDQLTGVFNRHRLSEVFSSLVQQKIPFGCVVVDIDNFKQINDTYGHTTGDAILKSFADFVAENIRHDDYFGRWGGEEFILFIPDIDQRRLFQKIDSLREKISKHPFCIEDALTVSIGLGMYDAEEKLETLVQKVDKALYRAKKAGKNRVERV